MVREYAEEPTGIADLVKWAGIVAPSIIHNKNGSLQATLTYRGPDLESATKSELVTTSARLNNLLKTFKDGWAIYSEAVRYPSYEYPEGQWSNPLAAMIDGERKLAFESGQYHESKYYITFIWLSPKDVTSKVESLFFEGGQKHNAKITASDNLKYFQDTLIHTINILQGIFPEARLLNDEETLTYLHSTVSNKTHKVSVPENPIELDYLLCDTAVIGGLEPKLGNKYIGVVGIRNFPSSSIPCILDELNHVGFAYRWVTRFLFFDKISGEAELNKIKRTQYAGRKSLLTFAKEMLFKSDSIMENTDSVNKALDADEALQSLAADAVNFGYFTQSIVIVDEDAKQLRKKTNEIERIINGRGFVSVNEIDNRNCLESWIGTIPGCCGHNVRYPILHTLNLTHLFPLSAVWAGPNENTHLSEVLSKKYKQKYTAPVHLLAITNGNVPFNLSLNIGDVGHTMVVGPTGSGKSVLLNTLELQWLRYPDAQVYIFDKGASSRVLTAGIGGDFYDLAAEDSALAFQPLRLIDNESERIWANEWIIDILISENVMITPRMKDELAKAINLLAKQAVHMRTMTGLRGLVAEPTIKEALLPYTKDPKSGVYGDLFDKNYDNLAYGNWQAFEMEALMNKKQALIPILSYLFHRLEQRFDGSPTLLVLDEAWVFLDHPVFSKKIREWLKVLRKSNVYVIFATQSLADIADSPIVATIKEACMSKIFLANKNALDEDTAIVYKMFGLNKRQISILAYATPKQDYYYTSPNGNRLFSLGLSKLALAYCAATDKSTQNLAKHILAEQSQQKNNFNAVYLKNLGLEEEAKYVENLYHNNLAA
ncbi:MAG: conjugal transfer protein TrbE [Pseudomonadota bacterium]